MMEVQINRKELAFCSRFLVSAEPKNTTYKMVALTCNREFKNLQQYIIKKFLSILSVVDPNHNCCKPSFSSDKTKCVR